MVVGAVNDGWRLAHLTLANERVAMATDRAGQPQDVKSYWLRGDYGT